MHKRSLKLKCETNVKRHLKYFDTLYWKSLKFLAPVPNSLWVVEVLPNEREKRGSGSRIHDKNSSIN